MEHLALHNGFGMERAKDGENFIDKQPAATVDGGELRGQCP